MLFYLDADRIHDDDSKFSRHLRKLLRGDDDDEKRAQKLTDLSFYLDLSENIKFVLKLGRASMNVLLKVLSDQKSNEIKSLLLECIGKIGQIIICNDREPK